MLNDLNGFDGCIQNLVIDNLAMNFAKDALMTANVKSCEFE